MLVVVVVSSAAGANAAAVWHGIAVLVGGARKASLLSYPMLCACLPPSLLSFFLLFTAVYVLRTAQY